MSHLNLTADQDIINADSDTRRRAAADFVRGLMEHFESQVTAIFLTYIQHFLQVKHNVRLNHLNCGVLTIFTHESNMLPAQKHTGKIRTLLFFC
jgi:hypothetical protein